MDQLYSDSRPTYIKKEVQEVELVDESDVSDFASEEEEQPDLMADGGMVKFPEPQLPCIMSVCSVKEEPQKLETVIIKEEPVDEDGANEGPSDSVSWYPRKRPKYVAVHTTECKVKAEPLDTVDSSTQEERAELGTIRQLLNTMQKPIDDDQVFGDHVASELRALRKPHLKRRLRRAIQEAILRIGREDDTDD